MHETRLVSLNGKLIPEADAKISIYDSALMFGDMVFEMTRSFRKRQFMLEEHIKRLFIGLNILRIPVAINEAQLIDECYRVIDANDHLFAADDEHRLMIDVSRGVLGIYQGIEGLEKGPNVVVADFPLRWTVAGMGELFDKGINMVITSQRAIPASLMDPKIKNRSRLWYQMANIEVSDLPGTNNWPLLLDPDGFVAEGPGDNFFLVKQGRLFTPEGRNILRGISRGYIFELASQLGIEAIETNIEPYDIYSADEAFLTATPFCMLPTTHLNGLPIGEGKSGPIFKALLEQWSSNVGVDIEGQIRGYGRENKAGEAPISGSTPYSFKSAKP